MTSPAPSPELRPAGMPAEAPAVPTGFEGLTLEQQYERAAEMVGNAKYMMQAGAGRGNGDRTILKNSLDILESTTKTIAEKDGVTPESDDFTLRQIASMELASEKQALRAAEEEAKRVAKGEKPPLLARAANVVGKIAKSKITKALLVVGVGAAVAFGIATGTALPFALAAPAIVSKGLIGLAAGGAGANVAHRVTRSAEARQERHAENSEEKTRERLATELAAQKTAAEATGDDKKSVYQTALEQAIATREKNTAARKEKVAAGLGKATAKGMVKGFVTGTAVGLGMSFLGFETPNFLGKWGADPDTTQMIKKAIPTTGTGTGNGTGTGTGANAAPTPKVTPSGEVTPSPKPTSGSEFTPGGNPKPPVETGPTLTTPEATAAEQAVIDGMMENQAEVGQANLKEAAATFEGKGKNIWSKYQNGAGAEKLSNRETWYAVVGDGPKNGGLEQMNATKLFDIDMGGQAKMTAEGIKFSGDTWWVDSTVAKEDLYIASADGKTTLFFDKGHKLTQNEQLAALKLLSQKGTEILDADTVREMIDKEFNPTPQELGVQLKANADQVTTEFDKQWAEQNKIDPVVGTEAIQAVQRAQMQAIIDANAGTLKSYPDSYLKYLVQQFDAKSDVPPAVIEEMLEKSLGKQLQLV